MKKNKIKRIYSTSYLSTYFSTEFIVVVVYSNWLLIMIIDNNNYNKTENSCGKKELTKTKKYKNTYKYLYAQSNSFSIYLLLSDNVNMLFYSNFLVAIHTFGFAYFTFHHFFRSTILHCFSLVYRSMFVSMFFIRVCFFTSYYLTFCSFFFLYSKMKIQKKK